MGFVGGAQIRQAWYWPPGLPTFLLDRPRRPGRLPGVGVERPRRPGRPPGVGDERPRRPGRLPGVGVEAATDPGQRDTNRPVNAPRRPGFRPSALNPAAAVRRPSPESHPLTPMRTCVRMSPGPYQPVRELEGALARGELDMAIGYAKEVGDRRGRPIDLGLALRFLPLVVAQRVREYDAWALRWLGRWVDEAPEATIEQAAELAASLADLPTEPSAWDAISAHMATGTRQS